MAQKYLYNNSGVVTERELTVASAGAGDAGKGVALDGAGKLDNSTMPTGIGANTVTAPSSENLAAGDYVNLWDDAGALKVRKADATTTGKRADGFVLAAATSPANAVVYLPGNTNSQLSSLALAAEYFLGTTAGAGAATAPSGSGNVVQRLGKATSATTLDFAPYAPIVLA